MLTRKRILTFFPDGGLRRQFNICPESNLIYVTNQRSGCSSLKIAMQRLHTKNPEYMTDNPHKNSVLPSVEDIGWPRFLQMLSGEACVFTFVRNPINRFASSFAKTRQKNFRAEVAKVIGTSGAVDREITPDLFAASLENSDPVHMNPHWRPQYLNVMSDILSYSFIGRLENFQEDFQELKRRANLPDIPLPWWRKTQNKAELSKETIRRVRSIYAKDFELFGYS